MTRVIVNSIPKSGTHLVERALALLGVSREKPLFLSSATADEYAPDGGETVSVGVGKPVAVSARKLRSALDGLPAGRVVTAHVPYSDGLEQLLVGAGYRMILIVRDPRDVAVSLAHHIAREKGHRLHEVFGAISPEQRISLAINGCDGLEDVGRRFEAVLPWIGRQICLLVRFEDLVGARGGGDDVKQRSAIAAICGHLGITGAEGGVGERLFGEGATFRKGTIGQWREQFSVEHEAIFAQVTGGLLERLGYR